MWKGEEILKGTKPKSRDIPSAWYDGYAFVKTCKIEMSALKIEMSALSRQEVCKRRRRDFQRGLGLRCLFATIRTRKGVLDVFPT